MSRTIAEREAMAREYNCPTCHAEAGNPCRTRTRHGPGPALKGVHAERMALLPFELTWHRTRAGVSRAIDDRVSPHVIYQVGKGEVRYGYPWYVSCWREGEGDESTAQCHKNLSSQATAKRLASHSRCHDCGRFVMFGDLEPQMPGSQLYQCRDRESCQAIVAEKEARELEELRRIETEPYEAIELREGRFAPELVFTRAGMKGRSSNVIRATPADIDRLIEVLTAWKSANPPFDVDITPAAPGPDWEWTDEHTS